MPIPARYLRLFEAELEPGERIVSAGNADLWLRYRRVALTDRRLLVVERGGVRKPWGGRRVTSLALDAIRSVEVSRNPLQHDIRFVLADGSRRSFAFPSISKGTARFADAVQRAVAHGEPHGSDPTPSPSPS